jgi:hypothetical protein
MYQDPMDGVSAFKRRIIDKRYLIHNYFKRSDYINNLVLSLVSKSMIRARESVQSFLLSTVTAALRQTYWDATKIRSPLYYIHDNTQNTSTLKN